MNIYCTVYSRRGRAVAYNDTVKVKDMLIHMTRCVTLHKSVVILQGFSARCDEDEDGYGGMNEGSSRPPRSEAGGILRPFVIDQIALHFPHKTLVP